MPLDMGAWPLTPSPTMWIMPLRARRRFASLASERHRQTGDALSALAEVSLHVAGAHAAHVRPGGLWQRALGALALLSFAALHAAERCRSPLTLMSLPCADHVR